MARKWFKGETYADALSRVMENNLDVPKGLKFKEWKSEVNSRLESKAAGLKDFFKHKTAEELYKDYKSEGEQFEKDVEKANRENEKKAKEEAEKALQETLKNALHPPVVKPQRQGKVVKERKIIEGKGIFIPQKKSSSGKVYASSWHKWKRPEERFIYARLNVRSTTKITQDFNRTFGMKLSVGAIQREKGRLKKAK